jgi:hypothetical protein
MLRIAPQGESRKMHEVAESGRQEGPSRRDVDGPIRPCVKSPGDRSARVRDFEVDKIRPLLNGSTSLIAAKPLSGRASALGSAAAVGMFATTLSFLATHHVNR